MAPYLADTDPVVREAAVGAAGHLLKAPELRGRIPEAAGRLRTTLTTSKDRRERAAAVLTLDAWAQDTGDLFPALAPRSAGDPRPTAILLDALSDPHAADHWFDPEALRCEPSLFSPGVDSRGRAVVRSGIGGSRRRGSCWPSGRTAYRQPPFRRTMSALRVVAKAHHAA